jgi:hypothetical protein
MTTAVPTTIEDLIEQSQEIADMYDNTPVRGKDGLYGMALNEGLTEKEIELAPMYAALSAGTMIVTGELGSGKGTFSNHLAWENRRLFKGRRVLLDYHPKSLFDLGSEANRYVLFDTDFLNDEMDKMAVNTGLGTLDDEGNWISSRKLKAEDAKKAITDIAETWLKKNDVLLRDGVLCIDELKRKMHNRKGMDKENILLGHIITQSRHLHLLFLGMCPFTNEIDVKSCLQYMKFHVRCSKGAKEFASYVYASFWRVDRVDETGRIYTKGKHPLLIKVNGAQHFPEIGVQLLDIEKDKEMLDFGEKENLIVEYLTGMKKHIANLNMINTAVQEDLNELAERLMYMDDLGIVQCKRFWDIFESEDYKKLK